MYEKDDPDLGPDGEVCGGFVILEEADVPAWVAVVGVVGFYIGRALLALGLVCFLGVMLLWAAGGVP